MWNEKSHENVKKKEIKVKQKTPFMVKLKYSKTNFTKEVLFMYFNTQEEIITRIGKSLEKSFILRKK